MLTPLLLLLSVLGVTLAALVLRAAPRRHDHRFFAALVLVDSLMAAARGLLLIAGHALTDGVAKQTATAFGVLTAYLSLEFAYSFPFDRRPSRVFRATAAGIALLGLGLALHPASWEWFWGVGSYAYFLSYFAVTITFLFRNYRELSKRGELAGIPLVMSAVGIRWAGALFAYVVAQSMSPAIFSMAVQVEATAIVVVSYLLFGHAVLRYNLFRIRGVVAEIVLYGGFTGFALWLVALAVDTALAIVPEGALLRAALVVVALVPVALLAFGRFIYPRVGEAILDEIDPRRALAKSVLSRVARARERSVDPAVALSMTIDAMAELSGGEVRFFRGPAPWPATPGPASEELTPSVAAHLLDLEDGFLHRPHAHGLPSGPAKALAAMPGDLLVMSRRARELYGVFAIAGGQIDRNVVATATTLSERLALTLENHRLFAQMLALTSELEEARRLASLGSFAAAIAHDIRTPLTSVQMNVQIVRKKAGLSPDDVEYLDIALYELKRLNESISGILEYAKPVELTTTPSELPSIAEEAMKTVEPIFAERKLKLVRRQDGDLPRVLVDPNRLRHVLINLLDNAAHASNLGATIVVSTRRSADGKAVVEVSDSGRGIRSEHMPKIFEPFFTTRADGTGLGLAIAQKFVRAHGGEIRVESTPGQGSTFTVLLPPMLAA
jgi:signal transduction histidine kinase